MRGQTESRGSGSGSGREGYARASELCPPSPLSHDGKEMPAASAMPAKGTPLAEKKDRRESSKSSGDTDRPPLRAVRIAATKRKKREVKKWN